MSPRQASKLIADVERRDVEAFRRALAAMADYELESRGGPGGRGGLDEETAALRAVLVAAG
jgi:DNA polymerase-3 subunit delta